MRTRPLAARFLFTLAVISCPPVLAPAAAQSTPAHSAVSRAPRPEFRQAANDTSAGLGEVVWTDSSLDQGNSSYFEGMSIPQRLFVERLVPGGTDGQHDHELRFVVQATKNGVHVYDFLTSWQQAIDSANSISRTPSDLLPTLFVNRCDPAEGQTRDVCAGMVHSIDAPIDDVLDPTGGPAGADDVQARALEFENRFGDRFAQIFGNAPFQSAEVDFVGYTAPDAAGEVDAIYEIRWRSTSSKVRIEFASHLALTGVQDMPDALAYDPGYGSSEIDGNSFHVRLGSADHSSLPPVATQVSSTDVLDPPPQACVVGGPDRICGGNTYTYTVVAVPPVPGLSYSWSLHTVPTGGCPALGTSDAFFCGPTNQQSVCVNAGTVDSRFVLKAVISNSSGSTTCCLSIHTNQNTTSTPLSHAAVCAGLTHTFCTTPSGSGPFTFAWSKNQVIIPGATGSCYTATAGTAGTVDNYCVSVTGTGTCPGPYTTCANLLALADIITTPLVSARRCEGVAYQFCTTPIGAGPYTFAWTKNGVTIAGETSSCYTAITPPSGTADEYCVTVTGACGSAQSCAMLTAERNATASALSPATVCEGFTHTFCTTAGGSGPFTYAWTRNGSPIVGATDSCYTATAGTGGAVDSYCVTVTGECSTAQSCATLTASTNVTASNLTSAEACEGLTHQFCTTAGGSGPFTYAWTKNGSPIAGATGSCYTATAGTGDAVDSYCVTVSGACGTPVQRCATLTAKSNVTATALTSAEACEGLTHQFCTTAGGSGPFTYAWTKNGSPIAGATGSCYTATAGTGGAVDSYCVTVSGACGTPVERCASLTSRANVAATDIPDTTDCEGESVTLCTTAGGAGPFTYQWSRNGTAVPGQTNSCYTFDLASGDTQVCVTVGGACGAPVQQCAVLSVQDCGGAHCTLTQGAYGNAGGQFNGILRPALIEDLLQGGMTVGVPGVRSLTFQGTAHDAQCVIDRLPTSGTATTLPDFGDESLESDCQTSPTAIPLQSGRFQNVLLGQVITLSLNMRLSQGVASPNGCTNAGTNLDDQQVCHTMVSRGMLPGPDGCIGTADDVPDLNGPDGNPGTPDNLMTLTIPQSALDSLAILGVPQTVGGLLTLGNRALAGMSTGTASLSDVNAAVDGINNLFDECRELVSCTDP